MKKYTFLLSFDGGKKKISTVAQDRKTAAQIVCMAEGCPERAITFIKAERI